MSERFYSSAPLAAGMAELDGEEAHHLAAVCRLRPGDPLLLFNGDGLEYPARVRNISAGRVSLDVLSPSAVDRELNFFLTVACPPPKGDRIQFLVEKLTELGVSRYVPLATQRRRPHPREIRPEKLRRHVIEACKQCGRNVLLQIDPPAAWDDFCRRELTAAKLLGHPGGRQLGELKDELSAAREIAIAVGPEGGFTDDEIERARQFGWQLVSLGPRILRVETAAVFLASALSAGRGP